MKPYGQFLVWKYKLKIEKKKVRTEFPSSKHLIGLCEPKRREERLRAVRKRRWHERVCCCPRREEDKRQRVRKMDVIQRRRQWWICSFMTFLMLDFYIFLFQSCEWKRVNSNSSEVYQSWNISNSDYDDESAHLLEWM